MGLNGAKWAPPTGGRRGLASSRRPAKLDPALTGPVGRTFDDQAGTMKKIIRDVQDGELWAPLAGQWEHVLNTSAKPALAAFLHKGESATSSTASFTEKLEVKRARRKRGKLARKPKKRSNPGDVFRAATQNFNGGPGEEKMEEVASNVQQRNIVVVFGQEGRRRQNKIERWDTGEIFLRAPAAQGRPDADLPKKKDGNFFLAHWGEAFIKGESVYECVPPD
jgi:hypothetical protein